MEINVDDNNFQQEVAESKLPVLVDFWAPWCGPCNIVGPIVAEIAEEYAGKLKVCKVNVDNANATANSFGIRGIPTLMIFKGGEVVEQIVGAVPKSQITARLDGVLEKG
jgi:thioredoxin 1